MTRKLFWDDPYRTSASATVTSVDGDIVQLDGTVFFAFAGGQERDLGTIDGYEVLDARWEGADIIYRLPADHSVRQGEHVVVAVDPERRNSLRRLHMATEIVLVLLTNADPRLVKVGAHISAARARIDFATDGSLADGLAEIEVAANRMVEEDREIVRAFVEGSDNRRYWEIADFAKVPCGGTLPARTGEIGRIRLKRRNPGKGKERVVVTIG